MNKLLKANDHELIRSYLDGKEIEFLNDSGIWKTIPAYENKYDIFRITGDHIFRIKETYEYLIFDDIPATIEKEVEQCIVDIDEQLSKRGKLTYSEDELIKQVAFHFYHKGAEDSNPCN